MFNIVLGVHYIVFYRFDYCLLFSEASILHFFSYWQDKNNFCSFIIFVHQDNTPFHMWLPDLFWTSNIVKLKCRIINFMPSLQLLCFDRLFYDEALALSHVHKRLHLRCLTEFWVRDNYLSVNFPSQPFLLLSCFWWFKTFFHTPALQLTTKSYWENWLHVPICSYIF